MDYAGNPIGGGMGAQTNMGGARMRVGPAYGGQPNPGDLYNPGGNRFMPGRGMVPPAGRVGNPRQVNPGQGPMRPGQPSMPTPEDVGRAGGGMINGLFPGLGGQLPPGALDKGIQIGVGQMFPGSGRGKGGGGGKGGYPGPGRPGFGPPPAPIFDPKSIDMPDIGGDGGGGDPGYVMDMPDFNGDGGGGTVYGPFAKNF
jgi:hypothetical protein